MRRRTFLAAAGAASGAFLAGCGDPAAESTPNGTDSDAGPRAAGDGDVGTPDAAATPDDTPTTEGTATSTESTETDPSTAEESTAEESTPGETATPGEGGDGGRNAMEYPSEYVDVRDVEYDGNEGEERGPTVSGVVQNVSTEELSLVEAKVWAYDDGDEEVGEALDDTTDLGPGETWEFACELWDTDADEVAYWKGRIDVSTY